MSPSVVAVSSGDSPTSKTRALAAAALEIEGGGRLIDLIDLPADALLGRRADPAVDDAVAAAGAADVLVLATPVYRATYSGTLKVFLDRFPADALTRTAVVLCASAGGPAHFLALDTGGRSLVASLGGWTVPTVVYATGADFDDGVPGPAVMGMLTEALGQAHAVGAGVDREPGPR
jgi:FMN reductase